MKASELIYRLARAIEENGDAELYMAIAFDNDGEVESGVKCLDINKAIGGDTYFEIYGESK